jgi:hypothetical protein
VPNALKAVYRWCIGALLTNDSVLFANLHLGRSHVPDFDLAVCTIDKNVVTLDVAMDDRRVVRVKIDQAFQDLSAPSLDDFDIGMLQLADISSTH